MRLDIEKEALTPIQLAAPLTLGKIDDFLGIPTNVTFQSSDAHQYRYFDVGREAEIGLIALGNGSFHYNGVGFGHLAGVSVLVPVYDVSYEGLRMLILDMKIMAEKNPDDWTAEEIGSIFRLARLYDVNRTERENASADARDKISRALEQLSASVSGLEGVFAEDQKTRAGETGMCLAPDGSH